MATSALVYDLVGAVAVSIAFAGSVVFVSAETDASVGASMTVACSVHGSVVLSAAGVTIGVMVFPQEERKIDAAIMRMTYFFIKKNLESNTWRIVI